MDILRVNQSPESILLSITFNLIIITLIGGSIYIERKHLVIIKSLILIYLVITTVSLMVQYGGTL